MIVLIKCLYRVFCVANRLSYCLSYPQGLQIKNLTFHGKVSLGEDVYPQNLSTKILQIADLHFEFP